MTAVSKRLKATSLITAQAMCVCMIGTAKAVSAGQGFPGNGTAHKTTVADECASHFDWFAVRSFPFAAKARALARAASLGTGT